MAETARAHLRQSRLRPCRRGGGRRALEAARGEVAAALDVEAEELVFTSGGTEADALGLLGAARAARGRHIVVSALEHPAVMRAAEGLVAAGATLTSSRPGPTVWSAPRRSPPPSAPTPRSSPSCWCRTRSARCSRSPRSPACSTPDRRRRPHFHVDAVQAFGMLRLRPRALGADTLALSAHKLHGPRGAGALWVARARASSRSGSAAARNGAGAGHREPAGIVGFGRAAALARRSLEPAAPRPWRRCGTGWKTARWRRSPGARPTVTGAARAPHIASLAFPGFPAEPLLHALEARGVLASAGSACASRKAGPSPTLKAIGVDDRTGVLRFSLSRDTTQADVDGAIAALGRARESPPARRRRDREGPLAARGRRRQPARPRAPSPSAPRAGRRPRP